MAAHTITIMTRKSNASSSKDNEIKKLAKAYEKKGVNINITSTELQLVLANGSNKEIEASTAQNLRARMEKNGLMGDWKPA
ncbi:hypothetical protein ACLX1H_000218 [Fusarium chlamydosporum]